MSLRESKKLRLRQELIENAIALFREAGFEATRVQEIAARCRVSEATFFNYFGCKEAVLGEWAHALVAGALASAPSPGGAPASAEGALRRHLRDRVRILAATVEADRDFAARAFRRAPLLEPSTPTSPGGPTGPGPRTLIEQAQARGDVRSDLPPEQIADLLHAALAQGVAAWLAGETRPREALAPRLLRTADLLVDGLRKRNERVRAPLGAPTAAPGMG